MDVNSESTVGGGVATLEPPAQATTPAPEGNGLFPQPPQAAEVAAPEAATMPSIGTTEAQTPQASTPEAAAPVMPEMPSVGAKPLDAMNPLANPPLGAPEVPTLKATRDTFVSEKAAAQGAPEKPKMFHRVLGALGLRASATTVPANPLSVPDHLTTTPQGTVETQWNSGVKPPEDTASASTGSTPTTESAASDTTGVDTTLGAGTESPKPASDVLTQAENVAANATANADATEKAEAVGAADEIVKNASAVSGAMDEIDKTAVNAMGGTESVSTENSTKTTEDPAPSAVPEAAPSWPSSPSSEPTTSGPAATAAPTAAPITEYHPTDAMVPAGEAAAPSTPAVSPEPASAAPASWSVDATASHPDAPSVEASSPDSKTLDGVPPFDVSSLAEKSAATDVPPTMASPDPAGLNLETTPTPLANFDKPAEAPFGTGMPQTNANSSTATTGGEATSPVEPEMPTPTVPPVTEEPTMATPSMGEQPDASTSVANEPVASTSVTEAPVQTAGFGGNDVAAETANVADNATSVPSDNTSEVSNSSDGTTGAPPSPAPVL